MYHPGITATEKKDFVTTLLAKSANANTVRFINFLIAKKRIFHLASISASFNAMLAEDEKRLDVKVESFKPLSSDLQNRIKDQLKLMTKKDITLVSEINASLLGGMRLTLGDKVIDGSVSNQLKKLSRIVTAV